MINKPFKKSLSLDMLISELEVATGASWVSAGNIRWIANRMAIGAAGAWRNFRDESRFDCTRIILPLNTVGSTVNAAFRVAPLQLSFILRAALLQPCYPTLSHSPIFYRIPYLSPSPSTFPSISSSPDATSRSLLARLWSLS